MNAKPLEECFALGIYPRRYVTIVRGDGALLWDAAGNEFIDCTAGVGVANVGHAHPMVAKAIAAQAAQLVTSPGIFYNDTRGRLMQKLVSLAPSGLNRVFLCNSGSESLEAAIKLARLTTGRTGLVSAMRGFHGRTLGALSATFKYRDAFEPLLPNCSFVPFNQVDKLDRAIDETTAAVILEPVQGEGGVRPADPGYLERARQLCSERGALLIIDEVQTGFCRTGSFFACDALNLEPDLLCLAKGIAGGIPMGAVLCSEQVQATVGSHGSTCGGNPLACAAALAAINCMEKEQLADRARDLGAYFYQRFCAELPLKVREVRQVGLMIGIELKEKVTPCLKALVDEGILALPAGSTVVRLLPPLVITRAQIDAVVVSLHKVLSP